MNQEVLLAVDGDPATPTGDVRPAQAGELVDARSGGGDGKSVATTGRDGCTPSTICRRSP